MPDNGTPAGLDEAELQKRVRHDYRLSEAEVEARLRAELPDLSADELRRWSDSGALEWRTIGGERRYFNRAVVNLWRLCPEARDRRAAHSGARPAGDTGVAGLEFDLLDHMRRALDAAKATGPGYVMPIRIRLDYTLTVRPGAVPEGETLRCWLPLPRVGGQHLDLAILATDPADAAAAPEEAPQRTLYLERPASPAGSPTVFSASYEFTSRDYVPLVDPERVRPTDASTELYREYTAERPPHLVLSPEIRGLASSIVGSEANPYRKARLIFAWFDRNVAYTATPEYSTIPNLSEYCLRERRGDCGVQAMLFIALCRAVGVPARWQSGLTLLPGKMNLHDWALFHVEPYGWLPADPSRGFRDTDDEELRWFYLGGIDAFRAVVNDDYGRSLHPPKRFARSEPADFQRGEVEWSGGNLYFGDWDYEFGIEYRELDSGGA